MIFLGKQNKTKKQHMYLQNCQVDFFGNKTKLTNRDDFSVVVSVLKDCLALKV